MGMLILLTASVSVGLTAPAESPFTIAIHPVFLRLDQEADPSRTRALGLDIDIKLGTVHVHVGWSALPLASLSSPSTKTAATLL